MLFDTGQPIGSLFKIKKIVLCSLSLLFILIMIMTIFWLIKILHNLIKHTIILKMLEWCTNVCLSHFIDQWSYTRFRSIRHNFFSQIIALDHHIIFFFIAYTLYNVAVYMMSQQQQKKIWWFPFIFFDISLLFPKKSEKIMTKKKLKI